MEYFISIEQQVPLHTTTTRISCSFKSQKLTYKPHTWKRESLPGKELSRTKAQCTGTGMYMGQVVNF